MKQTNIKPLGENVLIEPLKAGKKTDTGIFLPESVSAERPQEGRIIAVGESDKLKVKKGQKVIYNRYGGTEVKIEDREYLIVKNEDILAVVE